FISLHLPLSDETYHLIDAKRLGQMKASAILVNTSRGKIIDQVALYEALRGRRITAAALDVLEDETSPLAPDDPLLGLDNLIITPHVAQGSELTNNRRAVLAVNNLLAGLRGALPPVCVNPEALRNR